MTCSDTLWNCFKVKVPATDGRALAPDIHALCDCARRFFV